MESAPMTVWVYLPTLSRSLVELMPPKSGYASSDASRGFVPIKDYPSPLFECSQRVPMYTAFPRIGLEPPSSFM
jgi:hypothetical protein